jgi:hypothetical protein
LIRANVLLLAITLGLSGCGGAPVDRFRCNGPTIAEEVERMAKPLPADKAAKFRLAAECLVWRSGLLSVGPSSTEATTEAAIVRAMKGKSVDDTIAAYAALSPEDQADFEVIANGLRNSGPIPVHSDKQD